MNKLLGWCGPVLFVLGLITTFALEAPAIGIVLFVLGAIIWGRHDRARSEQYYAPHPRRCA